LEKYLDIIEKGGIIKNSRDLLNQHREAEKGDKSEYSEVCNFNI